MYVNIHVYILYILRVESRATLDFLARRKSVCRLARRLGPFFTLHSRLSEFPRATLNFVHTKSDSVYLKNVLSANEANGACVRWVQKKKKLRIKGAPWSLYRAHLTRSPHCFPYRYLLLFFFCALYTLRVISVTIAFFRAGRFWGALPIRSTSEAPFICPVPCCERVKFGSASQLCCVLWRCFEELPRTKSRVALVARLESVVPYWWLVMYW